QEKLAPDEVAAELKRRLCASGWGGSRRNAHYCARAGGLGLERFPTRRSHARVVWQGAVSPGLACRSRVRPADLRKPPRPKESFQAALCESGIRVSSAVFRELAERVSLRNCQDPAFQQFRDLMLDWFAAGSRHGGQ